MTPGLVIESAAVDEMHDVVSRTFAPHGLHVVQDLPLRGRLALLHAGTVTAVELGYGADVEVRVSDLPDFYNVHVPLRGYGRVAMGGRSIDADNTVVGPGRRLAMFWSGDSTTLILNFSGDAVRAALSARLGDRPCRALHFDGPVGLASPESAAWVTFANSFADTARSGMLQQSPLAAQHFERALIEGLLDTQLHSFSAEIADQEAPSMTATVRRAMRFCEDHAADPLTLGDIARAAGAGPRALQKGFKRHVGTTPMGYLRNVRLSHVHQELVAAAGDTTPGIVTAIALRWGFVHAGRFAYLYRQVYGSTPSQTLRHPPGTA